MTASSNPIDECIRVIARCPDKKIFGTDFVRAIDRYILQVYYPQVFIWVFLPYIIYFGSTAFYFSFFLPTHTFQQVLDDEINDSAPTKSRTAALALVGVAFASDLFYFIQTLILVFLDFNA